jgi:hypothetical protein
MNIFDDLQSKAYAIVADTMGYDAVWTKSTGGTASGRVLFNDPSKKMKVNVGMEYNPAGYSMEYHAGTFEGLEEAVQSGIANEYVSINGAEYWVQQVIKEFDGKSFVAVLAHKQ